MKPDSPLPTRLTRPQAANHLLCSVSSVMRYEKAELLASHKVGPRLVRLWEADVIAFAATREPGTSRKPKREKEQSKPTHTTAVNKRNKPDKAKKSGLRRRQPPPKK